MKKLNFFGNGSCFSGLDNTNAYFYINNTLYIIDCGFTTFSKIREKELLENYEKIIVIITHKHEDHIGTLASLITYCYYKLNKNPIVVTNDKKGIQRYCRTTGAFDNFYHLLNTKEFNKLNEVVKIKAYIQDHGPTVGPCYGYLFTINNNYNIFYSGDGKSIFKEILEMFFKNEINEFYQEVSFNNNIAHIGIDELINLFEPNIRFKINLMHFGNIKLIDKALNAGFSIVQEKKY